MPVKSSEIITAEAAAAMANLDRLSLLASNGTTVLATIPIVFSPGAAGVQSIASANANGVAAGTAALAKLHSSTAPDEITGLIVSTPATVNWGGALEYAIGDKRLGTEGNTYRATEAHTSDADTEPGVGPSWEDVWELIHVTIDNTSINVGQQVTVSSFAYTVDPNTP